MRASAFRRALVAPALALALLAAPAALAGDDEAFATLHERYQLLLRTIRASAGFLESDRPSLRALRDEAAAFNTAHPGHAGGIAIELQLAKWLADDDALVADLHRRLAAALPADVRPARAWIEYQAQKGLLDGAALDAAWDDLAERFPDDAALRDKVLTRLRDELRYPEIIERLEGRELDARNDGRALLLLAEAHFAEHHFDEALATVKRIDASQPKDFGLAREVEQFTTDALAYIDLWKAESALRDAEAAADDLPRARFTTSRGTILVELFENEAPNTVANFVSLADEGYYDGTRFHRFEPNFMIQGGDPNSRPVAEGETPKGPPGTGGPGYRIRDEVSNPAYRRHFRDSLAMAKSAAPDSGGSQFYLNHRPTPWLNGRHTVFGRVIEGLDVVRALRKDDVIERIEIVRRRDHDYVPETLPETDAG